MENKIYKLTSNTKVVFGIKLFQIQLIVDCKYGQIGDLGGWIEKESNLSGDAWVSGNARVYGDARVSGDANIYGDAWVSGNAKVYGNAQVYGDANVYGDAWVSGNAKVSGNAQVSGDAWEQSPLQIQGTKHFVNVCKKGYLQIGCKSFTFEYWKDNFETIGKQNGYSVEQIKEYGLYIDLAINLNK